MLQVKFPRSNAGDLGPVSPEERSKDACREDLVGRFLSGSDAQKKSEDSEV